MISRNCFENTKLGENFENRLGLPFGKQANWQIYHVGVAEEFCQPGI